MPEGCGKGGKLVATVIAPPVYERVDGQLEDQASHQGIEEGPPQSLLVHLPVYLYNGFHATLFCYLPVKFKPCTNKGSIISQSVPYLQCMERGSSLKQKKQT